MKARFATAVIAVMLLGSSQAFGWAHKTSDSQAPEFQTNGPTTSVPEPTSLFAIASGLILVGGAGWFIRRSRK